MRIPHQVSQTRRRINLKMWKR